MASTTNKQQEIEYIIENPGNSSGLKAIASVAIFFTLLGACFAPYVFSRQELTAQEQKLTRQITNLKEEVNRQDKLLTSRLETLEYWRIEHTGSQGATNAKQDTIDEWLTSIVGILFKREFDEDLSACKTSLTGGALPK